MLHPLGGALGPLPQLSKFIFIFDVLYIMPCLHPITIKTPESRLLMKCKKERRSFEYYLAQSNQRRNLLYDPFPIVDNPHDYYSIPSIPERLMQVPCGKCALCLKARVDGYIIRNYFEFLHTTLGLRGSAWFITLTYANDILPRERPLNIDEETGEILGFLDPVPCFDKRHIQLFLKRFRKNTGYNLKYFIVTEFGGEFGRPHYHAIFYIADLLPTEQNRLKLVDLIAKSWTKIDDRNFKYQSMPEYNLFDLQRVDVQILNSTKQIRYVCKYVSKQFDAVEFDKLSLDSRFKRFHLQSIGLGENIYDYCNADIWDSGFVSFDGFKYAIPQYYKLQKMREFYCEHENGSIIYRPSNFAFQYMENLCLAQVREHKSLSMLNPDYPRLPALFYDPVTFNQWLSAFPSYNFARLTITPFKIDGVVGLMFDLYQDYLQQVQNYNKARFSAQALKWENQQKEHYMKKTHRK